MKQTYSKSPARHPARNGASSSSRLSGGVSDKPRGRPYSENSQVYGNPTAKSRSPIRKHASSEADPWGRPNTRSETEEERSLSDTENHLINAWNQSRRLPAHTGRASSAKSSSKSTRYGSSSRSSSRSASQGRGMANPGRGGVAPHGSSPIRGGKYARMDGSTENPYKTRPPRRPLKSSPMTINEEPEASESEREMIRRFKALMNLGTANNEATTQEQESNTESNVTDSDSASTVAKEERNRIPLSSNIPFTQTITTVTGQGSVSSDQYLYDNEFAQPQANKTNEVKVMVKRRRVFQRSDDNTSDDQVYTETVLGEDADKQQIVQSVPLSLKTNADQDDMLEDEVFATSEDEEQFEPLFEQDDELEADEDELEADDDELSLEQEDLDSNIADTRKSSKLTESYTQENTESDEPKLQPKTDAALSSTRTYTLETATTLNTATTPISIKVKRKTRNVSALANLEQVQGSEAATSNSESALSGSNATLANSKTTNAQATESAAVANAVSQEVASGVNQEVAGSQEVASTVTQEVTEVKPKRVCRRKTTKATSEQEPNVDVANDATSTKSTKVASKKAPKEESAEQVVTDKIELASEAESTQEVAEAKPKRVCRRKSTKSETKEATTRTKSTKASADTSESESNSTLEVAEVKPKRTYRRKATKAEAESASESTSAKSAKAKAKSEPDDKSAQIVVADKAELEAESAQEVIETKPKRVCRRKSSKTEEASEEQPKARKTRATRPSK